ncbi:MAG: hypothetical protein JNL32_13535, partial [Candidatus Kapabacteria bacterium]|nr:hypothetical protein [Candidatus Kapabacteria bacterium]
FPPSALPRGWAGKNVYAEGTIVETIIDPTSPGYDEYEQSCGISGTSSEGQRRRVSVFRATYLEIGG